MITKVKNFLNDAEYKLYSLIWKRTVASQMTDAVYQQVNLELFPNSKFEFKYSGSFIKENGFKEIYDISENGDLSFVSAQYGVYDGT